MVTALSLFSCQGAGEEGTADEGPDWGEDPPQGARDGEPY